MSKGGDTTTTSTTVQDVPEWALPYYEDMLAKGKALSEEEYVAYTGPRIAEDSADLTASEQMVRDIAGTDPTYYDNASQTYGDLGASAASLGASDPYQFSTYKGYEAAAGATAPVQAFDYGDTRQFTGDEVTTYMSPYMDEVVAQQQADAIRQREMQQAALDASAVTAGAFGGSRQAVVEGMANEELSRQLADIYAEGQQAAFENAQAQFERDRTAEMTQTQQQAEELARVQGISVDEAARVQEGQAAEKARVQQAQADENMAQRQFELEAMGFSADMAGQIVAMEEARRATEVQNAQLLSAQGLSSMAREQAALDVAYQDFLRQQQYPQDQLAAYSAMLQGLPVQASGTTSVQEPYNPMQEALGAGISALGLYNGLQ